MVRVEHVMGTTVSIDVREPLVDPAALDDVVAWFHDVDARFSPFRPDSEVSRVGSGDLGSTTRARTCARCSPWRTSSASEPAATSIRAATAPTAARTRPAW